MAWVPGLRGSHVPLQHRPVFPVCADVIVVLGGGITPAGEPRPATMVRARRAAALYRSGLARWIVMSGAYGMYDPPPPRTEATVMAQVARATGVPGGDIVTETRSRDTIGNIWFTKPLLRQRGWHRVIVVTSGWHVPRVRYLTHTIWGPSYEVAIDAVTDAATAVTGEQGTRPPEETACRTDAATAVTGEQGTRPPEETACWEAGLLAVSRRWFATIRPGDDAAIAAVLAREHPVYADHPTITLAELAAMVTGHRRDRR